MIPGEGENLLKKVFSLPRAPSHFPKLFRKFHAGQLTAYQKCRGKPGVVFLPALKHTQKHQGKLALTLVSIVETS